MARTDQFLLQLLLVLVVTIVKTWGAGLGPPISAEEFAKAKGDPTLKAPPPDGVNAIENSGEFQGDIMLTPEQRMQMENGRAAMKYPIWENGVMPYTISDEFSNDHRLVIAEAMAEYAEKTCIKIVPRTNEADYVHIQNGGGCSSYLGRYGGEQALKLHIPGCIYFGIIIHEFMHASGFHHEQTRLDRDDYVTVHLENVMDGKEHNFNKLETWESTSLGLPYDYDSVMHYSGYAFSKNGEATIVSKTAGVTLGQRDGFSELDLEGLNILYECDDKPKPTTDKPKPTTDKPKPTEPPMKCEMTKKCKKKSGKCQSKTSECKGKIIKKGCDIKAGCVCCVPVVCKDKHKKCAQWANKGFCKNKKKEKKMKKKCPKICKMC